MLATMDGLYKNNENAPDSSCWESGLTDRRYGRKLVTSMPTKADLVHCLDGKSVDILVKNQEQKENFDGIVGDHIWNLYPDVVS